MSPSNPAGDVKSADLELVGRIRARRWGRVRGAVPAARHAALQSGEPDDWAREGEADDLLQDIFLLAYRKIGSFRGESSLGTWLYRLAMNHCLDVLRNRQTRMGHADRFAG